MSGGVPGIPTGGAVPTENPASSPSSAGTNTAQQQLMQQMLQMFAGGGGGGSATVHTYHKNYIFTLTSVWCVFFFFKVNVNSPPPVDPNPRGSVPDPAGPVECHGLHQPRGQPAGPHCYWRRHQRRYWETAGLTALVKTYSTYWHTHTCILHTYLTHTPSIYREPREI